MIDLKNEGLDVVAWRIGFPNNTGYKVYGQRQPWAYKKYGVPSVIVYEVQELCRHSEALAGYAVRDARIAELELLAAAISADCNGTANERNQFRAELAALKFELEGARTDELSAAVWAATETIKHDLWDAQAEIVKRDAQIATQEAQIKALQSGENCWQSGYDQGRRMGGRHCMLTVDQLRAELAALNAKLDASKFCANVADDLRAELAAIKAQESVEIGEISVAINNGSKQFIFDEYSAAYALPVGTHYLYAAPVAKQVVMPERDLFMAGVKAASDRVKAIVDDYDRRYGSTDPDTGTREYPGTGEEWVGQMLELIEDFTGIVAPREFTSLNAADQEGDQDE